MDTFVEEVLLPPSPLVVLCTAAGGAAPAPLLDVLALALRQAAPPFGSPGAGGGGAAQVQLRLEPRAPAPGASLYAPPRKRRSHGADFYEAYAPRGVLQNGWLQSESSGWRASAAARQPAQRHCKDIAATSQRRAAACAQRR
jgi:hypothetical protein